MAVPTVFCQRCIFISSLKIKLQLSRVYDIYLKADSSFSLKKYSLGTFALFGCRKPVNVVELKLLGQKEEVP
jgi:hypothetical protein